jgi:hypothetical protein
MESTPAVVAAVKQGAGARIVTGAGAGQLHHGVFGAHELDQEARRNGIHLGKSGSYVEILQGYGK